MANPINEYLLIDDTGDEHGVVPASQILTMCQQRLIAAKSQLSKKGLFSSYRPITEFPEFAQYVTPTSAAFDSKQEQERLFEAEHNPQSDAEMFLRVGEEQLGPYTAQQIRAMWANGKLPSNTLFYYDAVGDWKPAKSFCQKADSQRWDYRTIVVDVTFFGATADPNKINPGLQKYGAGGWELVGVCPITTTQMTVTRTHEIVLIFKRPA